MILRTYLGTRNRYARRDDRTKTLCLHKNTFFIPIYLSVASLDLKRFCVGSIMPYSLPVGDISFETRLYDAQYFRHGGCIRRRRGQ